MDRKREKYAVNIEYSGKQPPFLSPRNYEVQSSACGSLTSTDVIGDVGTNLTTVCTNTGTFGHSEVPDRELQHCQEARSFFSNWSLWKIFLTCLLASVITTAIGVLVVCLVYNWKNNNATVVIQLPQNHGTTSSTIETSSKPTVPTTIIDSTTPSTVNTITTTTGSTSTEPTSTTTTASTETTIAKSTTLSETTTTMTAAVTTEATNTSANNTA
ncbi:dynactin-associated protein-like [Rhinolophus ferrumequinum]|uniref:dynactin-associated protein-like n=1 Tax=Rhinolophus ferrumequinum TaxID=59479 RepID=UPI00140F6404|nr:dynactin-associated protein-like [Rhinolophus ferrumequinum]